MDSETPRRPRPRRRASHKLSPSEPQGLDGSEPPEILTKPTPERLLEGVLALGREMHLGMDDGEIAESFLRTIEELFPGRQIAIRLERAGGERQAVLTRGTTLCAGALDGPLVLKRSSLGKTKLAPEVVAAGRVRLATTAPASIEGAQDGFSIPLVAGGEIYGVLDVGYQIGGEPEIMDSDERIFIPLANHLSVALRNVRLHAETEMLQDYLGKLVDHASALIVGIDPRWKITVFNRALSTLIGSSSAEMIGKDVREFLPAGERSKLTSVFARALSGHEASVDLELIDHTGRPVRTVWNVAAVGTGSGRRRVEAVVAVGQDITQLKSLERQVIQAEKLATLGQLAAGVVHELNNPLTSIIVYADFLLKKLEKAPGSFESADGDKLRRILEGAGRILNFSRDLVHYAKPTAEHLDVMSLNDVVRQSLSFCEHVVRRDGVIVSCDLADELPPLYGVRGQLQQVVINLVTNAVHALSAGRGKVSVKTYVPDDGHVALSITDNGIGVRQEDQERIFEPFFTTKTDGRGTGLGLSIVRNIVERHHGSIGVASAGVGKGATFTLILPTGHRAPER